MSTPVVTGLSQEQYDALVRDAMLWRTRGDELIQAAYAVTKDAEYIRPDADAIVSAVLVERLEQVISRIRGLEGR